METTSSQDGTQWSTEDFKGIDADPSSPASDQLDPAVTDLQIVFNAAKYIFEKNENQKRKPAWDLIETLEEYRLMVEEADQQISYFYDEYL